MKKFFIFLFAVCLFVSCQKSKPELKQSAGNEVIAIWSPNHEADLAGYKVHRGTASRNYDFSITVNAPDTSITILGLIAGTQYFFAVTAFDSSGNESGFSNEASITIPIPDISSPDIPKNLKVTKK